MKKLFLTIIAAALTLSSVSQTIGEAFYIYRNDGQFNAFFRDEVQSIDYSYEDADGKTYDEIVTQVVTTADSVYKIPLAVIDSVSFVKPEATYKEDVTYLDASLFDYIVSVEGQNITFRSETPEELLPKLGEKIATVDLTNKFPYGFLGTVNAIDKVSDGILIRCSNLALEDAVSRFYGIIHFKTNQESRARHRAPYSTHLLKIKDFGPITIPYHVPNTIFERKDVMGFGGQASFTVAIDPDLDIILSFAIDDNKDILSYNARINHVVQLTEDKEIVGAFTKEWKTTFYTQDFPLLWGLTFYFDLGLKAELSGELALGYHHSTTLRAGLDLTYYPKKPLDTKIVRWLYRSDGEDNLLYLAGKAEGKLGGYFGMGLGFINHGLAKLGCEFELGINGTAEFTLNLGEPADKSSTSCYDKCKDQKADLSLYLGTYLMTSLFEGDNQMIDDNMGDTGWWDKFSVQFSTGNDWDIAKLYEGYMLPRFEHVSLLRYDDDKTKADASYSIPYNSIQKCKVGFILYDSEGNVVGQKFYPEYYSNKAESSPLYPLTFTGLKLNEVYTIYPCISVLENDLLASPRYSEDMVLLLPNDVDEVVFNSAKLSGRVIPNDGWKGRKVYFQYTKVSKSSLENESWETLDAIYDEEQKTYSVILTDLTPATDYKYRMRCNNYGEELYSEEKTFKTKDYEVTVDIVTVASPYSASLSGHIVGYDPNQGHVYFNYTTDWTNGIWNEVNANYDAGTGLFTATLTSLKPSTKYFFKLIYVIYEDTYESVPFNFVTNDLSKELPGIFNFQQTGSTYQPNGFTYKGDMYSFEYSSAVTCQWGVAENSEDFGYVYEDLKGDTAHVSMKGFASPYTDTRFVFYRNEPISTATLYGYIKYEGDDNFYYGEKNDYNLIYDKLPEAKTLALTEVDENSAKVKCAYYEAAPWSGTCGIKYWEDTNINESKKILFDVAQEEIDIPITNLKPNTTYYYQALIKVDDKYVGTAGIEKNEIMAEEIKSFTTPALHSHALCPDDNHPHMIDLGLPSSTKWACCNVGATKPEENGGYYAWGETKEKDEYVWENYTHYDQSTNTSYSNSGFINIGSDISNTSYDVAHTQWKESWQMPTAEQYNELIDKTIYTWTNQNGVNGMLFIGTNGNSIFIPAAGDKWNKESFDKGERGSYWSSTQHGAKEAAWCLFVNSEGTTVDANTRYGGMTVRPVQPGIIIETGEATNIKTTTATLNGKMENYDKDDKSFKFVFLYSTSEDIQNSPDGRTVEAACDENGNLTADLSDLTDYTTYYYSAAYKEGNADYVLGEVMSFKTQVKVTTTENPNTTIISATLQGVCSKGVSIAGFSVKKEGESDYTQYEAYPDENGNYSAEVEGLDIDTKYFYYAFAQADDQTYKGTEFSFTTKPLCPDDHHPHMIDLGLPSGTKWACCNVGAEKPEESGGYYAWGETYEKDEYSWDTYSLYDVNRLENGGYFDVPVDISGTELDVAHVRWGNKWRMPSKTEFEELISVCTYKRIIYYDKLFGYSYDYFILFKGPNERYVAFPQTGLRQNSSPITNFSGLNYWSSTRDTSTNKEFVTGRSGYRDAFSLSGYEILIVTDFNRLQGFAVRPVGKE